MPICPICGTEVSEGAGFCPKCLRRLMRGKSTKGKSTKGKSKKKLAGIIVACVIAISAVIVVTTHLLTVPSGHVAELEYVGLSAYNFAQKLFGPELTSLQRKDLWEDYAGKPVEWTNELKYVSTEEGLVAYFLNPLDWVRTEVVAVFDESQRESLSNLKEGDLVSYTGVLASFGEAEIKLTDCTVASPPIVPSWWDDDIDTHNKRILVRDEMLYLGPSTYDDATEATGHLSPKITAIDREETGEPLWEGEETESVLVGVDSQYVYTWHLAKIVPMSEPDYPWYWFASNITALDKVSGQIGWHSPLSEDIDCLSQYDCLPDGWSQSDFVNCCILGKSVKEEIEEITNEGEPDLTFLIDKPPLSELTYEYQGVTYKSACAIYGGAGMECGALQALDQQTGDVLWMMTFREKGMNDFSIVDGILYVSTDEGVGAFKL
jgi:hypothetical protein